MIFCWLMLALPSSRRVFRRDVKIVRNAVQRSQIRACSQSSCPRRIPLQVEAEGSPAFPLTCFGTGAVIALKGTTIRSLIRIR